MVLCQSEPELEEHTVLCLGAVFASDDTSDTCFCEGLVLWETLLGLAVTRDLGAATEQEWPRSV